MLKGSLLTIKKGDNENLRMIMERKDRAVKFHASWPDTQENVLTKTASRADLRKGLYKLGITAVQPAKLYKVAKTLQNELCSIHNGNLAIDDHTGRIAIFVRIKKKKEKKPTVDVSGSLK